MSPVDEAEAYVNASNAWKRANPNPIAAKVGEAAGNMAWMATHELGTMFGGVPMPSTAEEKKEFVAQHSQTPAQKQTAEKYLEHLDAFRKGGESLGNVGAESVGTMVPFMVAEPLAAGLLPDKVFTFVKTATDLGFTSLMGAQGVHNFKTARQLGKAYGYDSPEFAQFAVASGVNATFAALGAAHMAGITAEGIKALRDNPKTATAAESAQSAAETHFDVPLEDLKPAEQREAIAAVPPGELAKVGQAVADTPSGEAVIDAVDKAQKPGLPKEPELSRDLTVRRDVVAPGDVVIPRGLVATKEPVASVRPEQSSLPKRSQSATSNAAGNFLASLRGPDRDAVADWIGADASRGFDKRMRQKFEDKVAWTERYGHLARPEVRRESWRNGPMWRILSAYRDVLEREPEPKTLETAPNQTVVPGTAPSPAKEPETVKAPTTEKPKPVAPTKAAAASSPAPVPIAAPQVTGTPPPGTVGEMKVGDISVDANRFQFKSGTSKETGASSLLADVNKWDPNLGGVVLVWQDPEDGKTYVINGHHRLELAKRLGEDRITVRNVEAPDAKTARAIGALANLAEGRGTAIDAAKFMRDSGHSAADLATRGISLQEPKVRDAIALSKLDDKMFRMVATGQLKESRAIAIADGTDDHQQQWDILKLVEDRESKGKPVSDAALSEMIRLVKSSGVHLETQSSLFGEQEIAHSLAFEKGELSAYVRKQLGEERRAFSAVASEGRAERLGREGNKINPERNAKIAQEAAQAQEVYDKLSGRVGAVSDALEAGARRLAEGEPAAKVKAETYEAVRKAITSEMGPSAPPSVAKAPPRAKKAGPPPVVVAEEKVPETKAPEPSPVRVRRADSAAANAARARIRARMSQLNVGFDPTLLSDMVELGYYHFRDGLDDFNAWSKQMLSELGEKAKPYLTAAWQGIHSLIEAGVEMPGDKEVESDGNGTLESAQRGNGRRRTARLPPKEAGSTESSRSVNGPPAGVPGGRGATGRTAARIKYDEKLVHGGKAQARVIDLAPAAPRGMPVVEQGAWAKRLKAAGLPEDMPAPTVALPQDIADRLIFPGQRELADYTLSSLEQNGGALLASGVGSGKSFLSAAVIADHLRRDPNAKVLVLTRNRGMIEQEDRGLLDVYGGFGIQVKDFDLAEVPKTKGVYATTYATLVRHPELADVPFTLVVADESGNARRWWDSDTGALTKRLTGNAKKSLYMSATPYHTPLELGYMDKLGLWPKDGFENWVAQFGVRRKEGRWFGTVSPAMMAGFRAQMIERGVFANMDIDLTGFDAHFGVVPLTKEQHTQLGNIQQAFDLAEQWYRGRGQPLVANRIRGLAVNFQKAWLERTRLPAVIDHVENLRNKGWQVVLFTETKAGRDELYKPLQDADYAMSGKIKALMQPLPDFVESLKEKFGDRVADLTGPYTARRRNELQEFLTGKKPIAVGTYASIGEGVSLHDTSGETPRAAVYAGVPWSGIALHQGTGRLWRYGTNSDVHATFLFSDSMPEKSLMDKVTARLASLNASVAGVERGKVLDGLRGDEESRTATMAYSLGGDTRLDPKDFKLVADTSNYRTLKDVKVGEASDAKNKGVQFYATADSPSFHRAAPPPSDFPIHLFPDFPKNALAALRDHEGDFDGWSADMLRRYPDLRAELAPYLRYAWDDLHSRARAKDIGPKGVELTPAERKKLAAARSDKRNVPLFGEIGPPPKEATKEPEQATLFHRGAADQGRGEGSGDNVPETLGKPVADVGVGKKYVTATGTTVYVLDGELARRLQANGIHAFTVKDSTQAQSPALDAIGNDKAAKEFMNGVKADAADGPVVVVTTAPGTDAATLEGRVAHELHHAWQFRLENAGQSLFSQQDLRELASHPAVLKVMPMLKSAGYEDSPAVAVMEVAARLADQGPRALGLTPNEGASFLDAYFKKLVDRHGDGAATALEGTLRKEFNEAHQNAITASGLGGSGKEPSGFVGGAEPPPGVVPPVEAAGKAGPPPGAGEEVGAAAVGPAFSKAAPAREEKKAEGIDWSSRIAVATGVLAHPFENIERDSPELAVALRRVRAAPEAAASVVNGFAGKLFGGMTPEQKWGFRLMADESTRSFLENFQPDEFKQYSEDPRIQQALTDYVPIRDEMAQMRRILGGKVIEGNYFPRSYPPGVAEPPVVSSFYDTGKVGPRRADAYQRLASANYFYEHGVRDPEPELRRKWIKTYLAYTEQEAFGAFAKDAHAVIHGDAFPAKVQWKDRTLYRKDVIEKVRNAVPGSHEEATLKRTLGVKELPDPKKMEAYGEYRFAPRNRQLRMAADELERTLKAAGADDPSLWAVQKKLAVDAATTESVYLAPKSIVKAMEWAQHADVVGPWLQSRALGRALYELGTWSRLQFILVSRGIVHAMNLGRSVAMQPRMGQLDPRGWIDAFRVMNPWSELSKGLKERANVFNPVYRGMLESGTISLPRVTDYTQDNFNPDSWLRWAAGHGSRWLYGEGGLHQRVSLMIGERETARLHEYIADNVRSEFPHATEDEVGKAVRTSVGMINRASWNMIQRGAGHFMLFPSWFWGRARFVLDHPFKSALPPAIVALAINNALYLMGHNADKDRWNAAAVEWDGHKVIPTLVFEPFTRHLMQMPYNELLQAAGAHPPPTSPFAEGSVGEWWQQAVPIVSEFAYLQPANRSAPLNARPITEPNDAEKPGPFHIMNYATWEKVRHMLNATSPLVTDWYDVLGENPRDMTLSLMGSMFGVANYPDNTKKSRSSRRFFPMAQRPPRVHPY